MSIETLYGLAEFYNVSTDYLLGLQREPTDDPHEIIATEYTGLSISSVKNLHKYLCRLKNSKYLKDIDGELHEVTTCEFNLLRAIFEIINELIVNENMYKLAKLLYELKYDSQTYLEDIDTIKKAYQDDNRSEAEKKSIYSHYEKDIDRINKNIKIDRYEISEFIVHLSDHYDQREQVKNNGNHNPTNK